MKIDRVEKSNVKRCVMPKLMIRQYNNSMRHIQELKKSTRLSFMHVQTRMKSTRVDCSNLEFSVMNYNHTALMMHMLKTLHARSSISSDAVQTYSNMLAMQPDETEDLVCNDFQRVVTKKAQKTPTQTCIIYTL